MINSEQIYRGHVTSYDKKKFFGFVQVEENSYFFFNDRKEQKQLKKYGVIVGIRKFCSGDEVEFKLRTSPKSENKLEAYNLLFIKNVRQQQLLEEAIEKEVLYGYLKLVEDIYFVKHSLTYVYVPLKISVWETEIEEIYFKRIDKLVKFRLTHTSKINNLSAVLLDRKFSEEYNQLAEFVKSNQRIDATVSGRNSCGLFVTILNGSISGFVSLKKATQSEQERLLKIRKGNNIFVQLKRIPDTKNLFFTLVDE